jgi:membrane protease YdiL (CAAX protease family)
MDAHMKDTRLELSTFLGLTFTASAVCWWLIITAGGIDAHGGAFVLALMWCPGLSALATRLVFQGNVRGEGWRWGGMRWAALGYVVPLVYATAAYGMVWLTGLGGVDLGRFRGNAVSFVIIGSLWSLIAATGEKLGWRGFLVPALVRRMSFGRTAIVSGAIWAAWHVPLIAFADYNAGTAMWYAVPVFVVAATIRSSR